MEIQESDYAAVTARLAAGEFHLHTGPFTFRIRTDLPLIVAGIWQLYRDFEFSTDPETFADFEVRFHRETGLRRWIRPLVRFSVDGLEPLMSLPLAQAFPVFEWGLNWCISAQCHQYLLIHAAIVERDGRALLMPAPPGSGKSTLCAALIHNGWRLLSDEVAIIDRNTGTFIPVPRPVSLKNESIDVISRFCPSTRFGSIVSDTHKGVVGHIHPPREAVAAQHVNAEPGLVILPSYQADTELEITEVSQAGMLMRVAENSFNYNLLGSQGFNLLADVMQRSSCYEIRYSDLQQALDVIDDLARE